MRTPKDHIFLFLKGIGMGSADIVPGVSGGTVAFITGIYEELISSIKSVDLNALKLLAKGKFLLFWQKVNGKFLMVLLSGILLSLVSLAKGISFLLENHPIQLWSFFFGLIVISALIICRDIKNWRWAVFVFLLLGSAIAFLITTVTPAETPNNYLIVFLSGAVAICAMILPGISGSFILLILGKYSFIIGALKDFKIPILLVFGAGCVVGLAAFSRLINWLFSRYKDLTIAILAGFMIGSLNKVWPWKQTVSTFTDRHGVIKPLIEENILPTTYQSLGHEPYFWQAIMFFALGVGMVALLEKLAQNLKYDR